MRKLSAPIAFVAGLWPLAGGLAGCSRAPRPVPAPLEWTIPTPPTEGPVVEPALLAHVLRGLQFLSTGHPGASVTDLRLALIYDPDSAFIHERLSVAWGASGEVEHARAVLADGLARAPLAPGLNLLAGELAAGDGRFSEAAERLRHAVADNALLARAAPELIDALLWTGEVTAAETSATELAARAPADTSLGLGLAAVLEDHGRLQAALEMYRRARRQRPADDGAALGEVRILLLEGRYAAAAEALVPLLHFYPDETSYFVEIARLFARAHRPEAAAYRDEALRQTANDPEGRVRIAASELGDGDHDAALALLRDTIKAHPEYAGARLFLADTLSHEGDAAGCLLALEPVHSGAAAVRRLRAECLAAKGELETALAELEAAVRGGLPRDELLAAVTLICRYASSEASAEALRARLVERLGRLVSDDDEVLSETTVLDYFGHREALDLIERLEPESSTDVDLVLRWTDLASRYGKLGAALGALERLLHRNGQSPVLLNALGFTLADAGERLEEAEVWLRRAHRLAPDQGFIVDSLGWLLHRTGDEAGASRLLEEADSLNPADPEILRHLGDVYAASGRKLEARRCYERALSRRPPAVLRQLILRRLGGAPSS